MSWHAARTLPALVLALAVTAVGPLALWSTPRPALEVRQRPWNQTSAGLPESAAPDSEQLAPGQLFQLPSDNPKAGTSARIAAIDVAFVSLNGGPEAVALELVLLRGPSSTGPFSQVARAEVTTTRDALLGAAFVRFPCDPIGDHETTPTLGSWYRFQLTQVGEAPVATIVRRRGRGGVDRGWGPVVKPVSQLAGQFLSPRPELDGLAFHASTPEPLAVGAGLARLTLRTGDTEGAPAQTLRVVEIEVPRNLTEAWLHFDFEPLRASYLLPIDFELELPPGVNLRGAKGQPSLRSYHGGERNPAGGALAGELFDPRRDLVFRVWTNDSKGLLEALGARALLGLALGLAALFGLAFRIARQAPPGD